MAWASSVRIDFALAISAIEEEIVVTAEAPVVETTNPNASASVSDEQIANLPLNGRDFTDFALLTPGATFGDTNAVQGARGGLNVGARAIQNSFNIDGANNQSSFFGEERGGTRPPFTFSQAAIKELQVIKSDYGTQFSSSGAVINAITKSGTNSFRGELWTYYTDDSMVGTTAGNAEVDPASRPSNRSSSTASPSAAPSSATSCTSSPRCDAQDFEIPYFVRVPATSPSTAMADWEALTGLDFATETGGQTTTRDFGQIPTTNDALVFLVKLDWQLGANHLLTIRDNYSDPGGRQPHLELRQHRPLQQRSRGEQLQLAGRHPQLGDLGHRLQRGLPPVVGRGTPPRRQQHHHPRGRDLPLSSPPGARTSSCPTSSMRTGSSSSTT